MMKGRRIVVGVTGGIAAYKAAELVRLLVKAGADTRVAMTAHATRFITPLTFEALSGHRVVWDMWGRETKPLDHIQWGQEADLVVIAPATADFIAKMAHGLGDDFLSSMILAATARILVCPSMNTRMFQNPVVQDNLLSLRNRGYHVMAPGEGELACGTEGPGRLPEPTEILEQIEALVRGKDLEGLRVLVTAGPTQEPIDPVRYITNRSSGKMGYAVAKVAAQRGAEVTLVSGPCDLKPPVGVRLHRVRTTEEMRRAVLKERPGVDVIIKAAAVLDYKPREMSRQKIKKENGTPSLDLVCTPDILAELGKTKDTPPCILVGFAAETEDLLAHASRKLNQKNLDLIVANDVTRKDAGFDADTNQVKILYRDGHTEDLPLMNKEDVADHILDSVKMLWKKEA
ncbi:MAG: bifunctional phosphopantothenoylcysteine decarboxylase/phosphopantothenate--cysteine ligase CoaBC [Deltaproteobacteria bacterium]|nr:bifunctional phosphopantothenoylcysteine decarboxylase/phosphopantothenate--cysteine ligase CoaBC [Deltaproteobacteria bacterium]MBW2130327.1 bifunctional phosphopantothenoylcysteine decarboxylase/phosphopantothenate--cysteine ligase CoaBC [Deltaproteobacteria bacterium]MBW2302706.1 bifunctional phosphopantothenoylcysteine decarboxylase/phosphopantothenate--cysteine ligase CoaBC [Deltaproteobacteria bacterium]